MDHLHLIANGENPFLHPSLRREGYALYAKASWHTSFLFFILNNSIVTMGERGLLSLVLMSLF